MKYYISLAVLLTVVVVSLPASAKTVSAPALPEQAGVYDVPGRPDMKLRVFTFKAKPAPVAPTLVCGLPDPGSTAPVASAGWVLPSEWTVALNPSSVPSSVGAGNLTAIVDNAFAAWEAQVPSVAVSSGATTTVNRAVRDGLNVIAWGRTSGSLATTYIWYVGGIAEEIDTIFNSKYKWDWADQSTDPNCAYSGAYDAQNILTHELGHTYGLDDHYTGDYVNATMYGYGSTQEMKKDTLTSGDIAGVEVLY